MRRLLLLLVGFVTAAGTAAASIDGGRLGSDGVLVAPRMSGTSLSDAGLMAITARGEIRRVLRPIWSPVALGGPDGPFAVTRRGQLAQPPGPLVVIDGARATEIPESSGARCVSWSRGGRMLSYLTGEVGTLAKSLPRDPRWTIEGTLWIVDRTAPSAPRRIQQGIFPLSECPSWSPGTSTLAYVKRSGSGWSLIVFRDGDSATVRELDTVSTRYRTFDWAPGSQRLVFLDAEALFEWSADGAVRLTEEGALAEVGAAPPDRFVHGIRLSPNGARLAVSIGRETAVFTRSGEFLRKIPGTFNGWAGNTGILTLRAEAVITLRLHQVAGAPRSRVIARWFKYGVVTHPSGRWFAYSDEIETGNRTRISFVYFRRPDGSVLKRVRVATDFFPLLLSGMTRDGRLIEPASAY